MNRTSIAADYNFSGRYFVITGGTGVLGQAMVRGLAGLGANLALLVRDEAKARHLLDSLPGGPEQGSTCVLQADVLDRTALEQAAAQLQERWPRLDGLINGAGGNFPRATTSPELKFFDLPDADLRRVFDLNLEGTILPCQIFGRRMAAQGDGIILNVSSMSALRPLTRVVGYSAAKAAVNNFTQWLAVHMAREYSPRIRVNALAPGFFLTEQNRFLLTDAATGKLTMRGQSIMDHTPMARFGEPEDLLGTLAWLLSPASDFVTGIVVPVDGGFSAFSGV